MIEIVFREEAANDLNSIIAWYEEVAPDAIDRILADIDRSIRQLRQHPFSGMRVPGRSFRRVVTLKYRFKLAYLVHDGWIEMLGIFRYQDRES